MSTRILTFAPTMLPLGRAVAAIGVFDGVHLGHQALVRACRERASEEGVASAVITFDRDPDRVVAPDRAAPQLLELEDKISFLAELGVDAVVVVPFDTATASMAPERFVDETLLRACTPVAVVVGEDFRFGRNASGDVDALRELGATRRFEVVPQPLVRVDGEPVTSTRIRSLVRAGDVATAAMLLGRPHRVRGLVVHGRGAGARLGAPTANLRPHPYAATPADGVYAAWGVLGDERYPAAVSVGSPPTFPAAAAAIEAHLLEPVSEDLYGADLALDFVERLRDLERFEDEDSLSSAIARDVERARVLLAQVRER
ncbi:bifunctional riboflavin kinase/FAD synthetase [Coriobacteriia bacterium Es71-Z0120]|uniref:bifunctional riboflavin kinase/FAD synthetase n=1 Tax=Parvivirga hydrogeniphila TaxID=2939460 RepID=UPI0022609A7C|nr:bifunctional riboflavin kinase/FAD synthetase [Parvivirga hydrogeniphila]MCL4079604.1 bifunctional riboflavin kinase/FAD synthetase [Parvivirga hydrogeniphila]